MDIGNLINAIRNSRVRITDHADEEAFDDNLTYEEIYSSVIHTRKFIRPSFKAKSLRITRMTDHTQAV